MASPNFYPSGFNFAGTVFQGGPSVAQLMPSFISGLVQWVDTINGNNSNSGAIPSLPVKTLAQAVTNSSANGLIIIGQGSSETYSGAITVSLAGLTVWGCGTGSNIPRYTNGVSSGYLIASSGAGQRWRNIHFGAATVSSNAHFDITGSRTEIRDCYFECNSTGYGINGDAGCSGLRVRGCSFVSTGTQAPSGYSSTSSVSDITFEDTIFDGASLGWSDYAFKISGSATTRLYFENVQFRNRSNLGITVTGCTYDLNGVIQDGTGEVVIAA